MNQAIPFVRPCEDVNILMYSQMKQLKSTYTYGSLIGLMKLEILSDMQNGAYTRKCYKCGKYFLSRDSFTNTCVDCKSK